MKSKFTTIGIGLLKSFLLVLVFTTASMAGKADDWKRLSDFHDGYIPFQSQYSAKSIDADYVSAWQAWRKAFEPFSQTFKTQYGASVVQLQKSFENEALPDGVRVYPHQLIDLLTMDLAGHQQTVAGWVKHKGDEALTRWKKFTNVSREKAELKADFADRARRFYTLANELSADIAKDNLAQAEKAYQQSFDEWKDVLDTIEWPGNNPQFAGPGDPDTLAAEALKLLESMREEGRQWSKPEYDDDHIPVAACVVGSDWEVHKKVPITNVPTQYTVKMFVVFKGTQNDDIGYAYYMQFYTREEAGVKKAPPFLYCNSRSYEKHKMLLSKVPSGSSGSASTGVAAMLLRLILAGTLIAGGLGVSGQVLVGKLAFLAPLVETLSRKKALLGLLLTGIGLALLVLSILTLSPLSNMLPQLCAIALGLAIMDTANLPTAGNPKVDASVRMVVGRLAPLCRALAPFAAILGQAALAVGLIHLLIGGVPLF
jgi:hypothetical protein